MSFATVSPSRTRAERHSVPLPLERPNAAPPRTTVSPRADVVAEVESADDLDLRQLRHHTKNALQRIMGLIAEAPGLYDTPEGERIAHLLEDRICRSAAISDSLFGLTRAPGSMTQRLRSLCDNLIEMTREPHQRIGHAISVRGDCPAHLRDAVLRTAHELILNSMKHGLRGLPSGRITIRLETIQGSRTVLTVMDDGRGFTNIPHDGEGLNLARGFASQHGGYIRLRSENGTIAVMTLPHGTSGHASVMGRA